MSAVTWLAGSLPVDGVVVPDNQHGIQSVPVGRSGESPDTAMGVFLGQTAVTGVDDCVTGLAFGAIEGRLDRLVAGSPIEALELDRCSVDASVGRAPAGAKAFGYRNHCRALVGEILRDPVLCR